MTRLRKSIHEVSAELTQLLDFLRTVGLDFSARGTHVVTADSVDESSTQDMCEGYKDCYINLDDCIYSSVGAVNTAQSWAVILAQGFKGSFPVHDYFQGFDLEDHCSFDSGFSLNARYGIGKTQRRRKAALFFLRHQDWASGKLLLMLQNPTLKYFD